MGREANAALNYQLTSFAQGHMNDTSRAYELAERLCPTVGVPGATGQYKVFDDINSFQIYETARGMGEDPRRIEFGAGDATYNCKPHALEVTVDDWERKQVGEGNGIGQQLLAEGKIKALINSRALSNAKRRVDAVLAALTPIAQRGDWSNPDVDPIEQLDEQIDEMSILAGSDEFIKITMSRTAWRILRNHPKAKARCNGVQAVPLSMEQVRDNLATPVDIKAFTISYNEKKLGQSPSKKRLLAGDVIIHISVPNPTQYDPSAFKCFAVGGNMVSAVRSWTSVNGLYEGHFVDWNEDMKQTSTLAARRLQLS